MKNIKHVTKDSHVILRMVCSKPGAKTYYSLQWYLRLWSGKKAIYYPLGRDLKKAAALADKIDGAVRSGRNLDDVKKEFRIGRKQREPEGKYSSLADLVRVLQEEYPLLDLSETTAKGYANSLVKIVREVLAAKGNTSEKTNDSIEANSCQVLTVTTLNEFKSLRHKAADKFDDELKKLSALRSANKDVRQAKAVFSNKALRIFAEKGILLPDMAAWKEVGQFGKVDVHYRLPEVGLIATVMGKIRQLTPGSEIWLATHLASQLGMRREELISCRWNWFKAGATLRVHIVRESDFVPKRGHERHIEVQRWVFEAIKSFQKSGSTYVLSGDADERRKTVDKTTVAFLRNAGIAAQKPVHELRKWFGSWTTAQRGLTFAQRQLGHDSQTTTEKHYGDVHFPEELAVWWEDGSHGGQTPSVE